MVLFPEELENRFIIEDHVGEGSYGMIYKVIKKSNFYLGNNKMYAMKVITRDNNSRWKDIEIEMQVLSFINPYKLHLDCFFVQGDKFFMVIDYCQNGTLLKAINDKEYKQEMFKEDDIWKYFIQICFGLESLHYNDFIHRDLHLQNILLDENNNIKIADFGISRYLGTNSIKGVEAIRSPRTLSGDIQTKESDIWAVGYCLYYLCTFNEYFGDDPNLSHMEISQDYSENLRSFVDWCLKKDRSERPTIIDILTHKFIVDKTWSLDIEIPQTSIMKTISLQNELSTYKGGEIESIILKLKRELSECRDEITNQNSLIKQLKVEIASLNNIIATKGNDIETFRLKAVEISKILEKWTSLNEKKLVEVKNSIRTLIAYVEKSNRMLDYSDQYLNKKRNENLLLTQALSKNRSILSKGSSKIAEQSFRESCLLYEKGFPDSDLPLSQDFQEYINFYHQITSLYLTKKDNNRTKLIIYDTESERKEEKILDVPELLNYRTCITQLPNSELFCYGKWDPVSGITLIIDRSYEVRILESGIPCKLSSGIYLNGNVYCFGGRDDNDNTLTLSNRFDLNDNRWKNNLNPMLQPDDLCCCVIFNNNILISGYWNRHILRYSVDSDSFSTIPYQFAEKKRKILINVERLYLIECGYGFIYESEAGDDFAWKQISESGIGASSPIQVYCSYNKGGIYIATSSSGYFKFDLRQNIITKLQ